MLALLATPVIVHAHALPVLSSPHAGETLDQAPSTVLMTFGERPDPRLSAIHVLNSERRDHDRGPTTVVPGIPMELTVAVEPLPHGVYTVNWRTVSAVDGHLATGAFTFGVGVTPADGARADLVSPAPSAGAIAGRALLYVGMVALFGMSMIAVVAFPEPPAAALQLLPAGAAALAMGVLMVAVAQGADAGLSVQEYLGSALVRGFAERAVPAVVAIAALVVTLATGSAGGRRLGLLVVAALAATVMLMDVDTSHATAGGLPRLNGAFQWLHALGVGVWIGGLAALLVGIRGAPSEVSARAVRRFSAVAGVAVVVVGVTGLIRAGVDVGSVGALTSSLFGQLVLVKIALLSLLVVLGAANRFRHLPRAPHTLRRLRLVGSAELGLALVTLIVAGTLVNTVPPASGTSAVAPRSHPLAKVATFAPEPSSRPSATAGRSNAAPVP